MRSTTYSLAEGNSDEPYTTIIIHHCSTIVRVHNMVKVNFVKNPDELQFYGSDHGEEIAFETHKWVDAELELVTGAIHWYADEILNYPEMDLSIIDPRPPIILRIVR